MSSWDGGQAFPHGDPTHGGDVGMSLRDWFAGQALAGICANGIPGDHHIPETTVMNAYQLADLMLKERAK